MRMGQRQNQYHEHGTEQLDHTKILNINPYGLTPGNTPSLEGQTVSKFRQGKFVETGNISAFIGSSLSLPLMRNYIKSLLEYFGDSDLFECRYS